MQTHVRPVRLYEILETEIQTVVKWWMHVQTNGGGERSQWRCAGHSGQGVFNLCKFVVSSSRQFCRTSLDFPRIVIPPRISQTEPISLEEEFVDDTTCNIFCWLAMCRATEQQLNKIEDKQKGIPIKE